MAELVVLTHQFDRFAWFAGSQGPPSRRLVSYYMLFPLLSELRRRGHATTVVSGPKPAPGDAAILHVDTTVVEPEYAEVGRRYSRQINFRATDISKRNVSGALLDRDSQWNGKVLVKTNRNVGGRAEARHNIRASRRGLTTPVPDWKDPRPYLLIPRIDDVADKLWDDSELVVERFVPELDPDGYAVRAWTFAGESEFCTRNVSRHWVVKAVDDVIKSTDSPVPESIRAERERLGLDYGNLDFVIHDDEPILLDASRTPGAPPPLWEWAEQVAADLADGLIALIEGQRSTN
jgi:hypothetical protein